MYVRTRPKMIFSAFFFFFCWKRLTYLLLHTETTAQYYLWLYHHAIVKGIQIISPLFICILKGVDIGGYRYLRYENAFRLFIRTFAKFVLFFYFYSVDSVKFLFYGTSCKWAISRLYRVGYFSLEFGEMSEFKWKMIILYSDNLKLNIQHNAFKFNLR